MLPEISVVRLNVQLTKKCNQRCVSCNSYELPSDDELSLDEFKSAIFQASNLFHLKNIAFTGGEPTLYRHFKEVASYAKGKAENVSVTTNGYYCTSEERIRELIEAGVNRFSFSYHGVGTHDAFTRLPGSEARLRKAIKTAARLRESYPHLYVKVGTLFDGQMSSAGGVKRVLDFCCEAGVDLYIELLDDCIPAFAGSKLSQDKRVISSDDIEHVISLFAEWKRNGYQINMDECAYPFIRKWFLHEEMRGECPLYRTDLYIESDGNVRTGCWSLPPIGNLRKSSLKSILNSDACRENVQRMVERQCSGCTCGYLMQARYLEA